MNPSKVDHNIKAGPVTHCQICGSQDLELVIDLGHQPLCDSLLSAEQLRQPETTYPLRQMWCRSCTLSQLDYIVPGEVVYHPTYPYRTGITKELATYQDAMAGDLIKALAIGDDSLAVDVGSNDGTLLKAFKRRGMRVVGVEPTNIASIARDDGIPTIQSPFNQDVANQIVSTDGRAKIVTATNVFAHMATLRDVMEGLEILVADDGCFVLENHYVTAIAEKTQFDTIYHEHLRTYSLKSLVTLFEYYDFTVVDAQKVSRYGGNIRVVAAKGRGRAPKPNVAKILAEEKAIGLSDPKYYEAFRKDSLDLKNQLIELVLECNRGSNRIVGNSCPGRSSTLLNFCGIGPDLLPYLAEQPTSLKLGKHLPGMHIPIVNNQRLIDEQPEFVLLLAWHYAEPIAEQLRARGLKSKFITPMPNVGVLEI